MQADITNPARSALLMELRANTLTENCLAIGAQGLIYWNMEGCNLFDMEWWGEPRLTEALTPEMDMIRDVMVLNIRRRRD